MNNKKIINCFKCKRNYTNVDVYIKHLQKEHSFKANDQFECTFYNCFQLFNNIYRSKRHWKKKHKIETKKQNVPNNNITPVCNNVENIPICNEIVGEHSINETVLESETNCENVIQN